MTTRFFVAIIAMLTVFVVCGSVYEAEAARFGGGRSFGGSSGFSRSFNSSSIPKSSVTNPAGAQRQPGALAGATARPALGGMLGGLLAGTLLGSLLSGHGFAGGGMLDILILGFAVYLLFKFLGRRRMGTPAQTSSSGLRMPLPDPDPQTRNAHQRNSAQGDNFWSNLGNSGSAASSDTTGGTAGVSVPQGFDVADFMDGAKVLYTRMNTSWDRRDLDDIAVFSTQPFMQEIREQAQESPNPERTEIILVNASLVDVIREAGRETASVYFDVTLREQGAAKPAQVREVWHFVRAVDSKEMWKLDGIQQVED